MSRNSVRGLEMFSLARLSTGGSMRAPLRNPNSEFVTLDAKFYVEAGCGTCPDILAALARLRRKVRDVLLFDNPGCRSQTRSTRGYHLSPLRGFEWCAG